MSVAVSISDRAENDLINQYRWYADNASEEIAERFLAAFQQTTDSLARMPQLGRLRWFRAPELFDMRSFALRKPFESHLVFYKATATEISIERVMHGSRDLSRRLIEGMSSQIES